MKLKPVLGASLIQASAKKLGGNKNEKVFIIITQFGNGYVDVGS